MDGFHFIDRCMFPIFFFWPRVYCGSYTRLGLRAMEKRMGDRLRAPRGTPLSRLAYTRLPIDCLICNYLWALALRQRTVFTDVVMTFELSTGKVMNSWQQGRNESCDSYISRNTRALTTWAFIGKVRHVGTSIERGFCPVVGPAV